MPALYSTNAGFRQFLGRWLALFESAFREVEHEISSLRQLFDPAAAPANWLDWLAGWLAVDLDDTWDEQRKRRAIAHAFRERRHRGTAQGLRNALARLAGVEARVEEPILQTAWWSLPPEHCPSNLAASGSILGFTTMLASAQPQGAVLGTTAVLDQSELTSADNFGAPLFQDVAWRFCVVVYRGQVNTPHKLNEVRAIVEREKPAHTACHVCVIESKMRVGFQARVGIDTVIAGPLPPTSLGDPPPPGAALVLGGILPGRLNGRTRAGENALLGAAAVDGPVVPASNYP